MFIGYACPLSSAEPIRCQPGQYSLGNMTVCTNCPGGYSCPNISSQSEICLAGTYALPGSTSCTPCDIGFTCPNNSTTEQLRYVVALPVATKC